MWAIGQRRGILVNLQQAYKHVREDRKADITENLGARFSLAL
jgi:hypothetical protein